MGAISHILIDGSNLLHAWPELRALLHRKQKEVARVQLVQKLLPLLPMGCQRLTVVFDGRGHEITTEYPHGPNSIAVIYTSAGMTADDIIEQLVAHAADPSGYLVSTADQAERATIEASGAVWCSPDELTARLGEARHALTRKTKQINQDSRQKWTAR